MRFVGACLLWTWIMSAQTQEPRSGDELSYRFVNSIDRKAYGFFYDDASDQAAFFSGKGREAVVTPCRDLPLSVP